MSSHNRHIAISKHHGRHELPAEATESTRSRSQLIFSALGVLLCVMLGIAIVTQVRQVESENALHTARPADLLIVLDSLRQREASLNTEIAELEQTLASIQAAGTNDHTAVEDARQRLAALSILAGTIAVTGPGVTIEIDDPGPGVAAETMLDVINELRAAGAEAILIRTDKNAVRVGVDTWVVGRAGALTIDSVTVESPYFVLAVGDSPTLAAALNIPGGAVDSVERVGATMVISQSDRVDIATLREPKARQYAQPSK